MSDILKVSDLESVLLNESKIAELSEAMKHDQLLIIEDAIDDGLIQKVITYLENVGRNSLPNYVPITLGCPNFHRINMEDERAYVKGCFHQFSFFPWNQDVLDLFSAFRSIYHLKKLLNSQPKEKFLGTEVEEGCIARLSFQFYPSGSGHLNKHQDPVDTNQLAVPIVAMSQKGVDFSEGGLYAVQNEEKIYIDDLVSPGDVALFNARLPHGVDTIDPQKETDWLSFSGRWMMIAATNKMQGSDGVDDAVDLEDT